MIKKRNACGRRDLLPNSHKYWIDIWQVEKNEVNGFQ